MFCFENFCEFAATNSSNLLIDFCSLEKLALLTQILHPNFNLLFVLVIHPPFFEIVGVREKMDTDEILFSTLLEEEATKENDI